MTPTHWLAFLCLAVQFGVIGVVIRWIHTSREATQAARELAAELRALRHPDTGTPDSEILGI